MENVFLGFFRIKKLFKIRIYCITSVYQFFLEKIHTSQFIDKAENCRFWGFKMLCKVLWIVLYFGSFRCISKNLKDFIAAVIYLLLRCSIFFTLTVFAHQPVLQFFFFGKSSTHTHSLSQYTQKSIILW